MRALDVTQSALPTDHVVNYAEGAAALSTELFGEREQPKPYIRLVPQPS